jgi:hypothetical protein
MAPPFITVSGNVTDPNGIPYAGGTITPVLNYPGGSSPTLPDGSIYYPPIGPFGLDNAGNFSFQLAANNQITPAGSTWSFIIASARGTVPIAFGKQSVSFQVPNLTLNASQDLTSTIATHVQPLTFSTGGGGGGGTVTNVSVGNLNPLFTTLVANPTTTPSVQFGLQNAPQLSLFGDPSATSAPPSFFSPGGDIQMQAGGSFNVSGLTFGTTHIAIAATPPTAGQVLTFDGTSVAGATPSPRVIASGTNTVAAQTFPANSLTRVVLNSSVAGVTNTDSIMWAVGGGTLVTALTGWNSGVLAILALKTGVGVIDIYVANSSSTAIAAAALPINWMVLRA